MKSIVDMDSMNFSWVIEGKLAGCRGPRTDDELVFLRTQGIDALVRLASETGMTRERVELIGITDCNETIVDFTAPSQEQIDRVVRFIQQALKSKKRVAVSCGWGYGRTGTILACFFVSQGQSARVAIEQLIAVRDCSREVLRVPGQEAAIHDFERRIRSGVVKL